MRAALLAMTFGALGTAAEAMTLASQDLKDGQPIAAAHIYPRCGGRNLSPQLSWAGAPAGTKSFAITMIDHNVPPNDWSHWIVVGVPPGVTALRQGAALPAGARALKTDFGDAAYGGPCPPAGTGTHHYEVTVWALPQASVSLGGTAKAVEAALQRGALDHASLTVTARTP
jgi:Raf kinase inhibitor-like YbhB/YbcL family protein